MSTSRTATTRPRRSRRRTPWRQSKPSERSVGRWVGRSARTEEGKGSEIGGGVTRGGVGNPRYEGVNGVVRGRSLTEYLAVEGS